MLTYIAQGVISHIGVDIHPAGRCFLVLCASKHTSQGALPTAPLAWGLPFAASLLPASLLALSSLRVVLQQEKGRRTWSLCSLKSAACAQSASFEVRSCAAQRSENAEGVRRTFWTKPAFRNRAGKNSARIDSPSFFHCPGSLSNPSSGLCSDATQIYITPPCQVSTWLPKLTCIR